MQKEDGNYFYSIFLSHVCKVSVTLGTLPSLNTEQAVRGARYPMSEYIV